MPLWIKWLGSLRRVGLAATPSEDAQIQARGAGQEARTSGS